MGERQNFYSLQLPEPGHIPSPRDSGLTGLFIISRALFLFCLCQFFCFVLVCFLFCFFPEWKSLRSKRNAEEGKKKKKSTGLAGCSCCRRRAGQAEILFFLLLLFSRALSPPSLLSLRRVTAPSWLFFLGGWLCPPPPPHPSTFPPYGQAAEQRLAREGEQKEANKPTPPRRPRTAPRQPSGSGSSKNLEENLVSASPSPLSEQELVRVP